MLPPDGQKHAKGDWIETHQRHQALELGHEKHADDDAHQDLWHKAAAEEEEEGKRQVKLLFKRQAPVDPGRVISVERGHLAGP